MQESPLEFFLAGFAMVFGVVLGFAAAVGVSVGVYKLLVHLCGVGG